MEFNTTEAEAKAIEAVKNAVKALPKSIWIQTDDDEGELRFWKRVNPCESKQASSVFKHRALRG
jgi:hypothetical protein